MPESRQQVKLAHAVLSGSARDTSMPAKVAAEIVSKMHGRSMKSLPLRKRKK
jgi:hypothetical protein